MGETVNFGDISTFEAALKISRAKDEERARALAVLKEWKAELEGANIPPASLRPDNPHILRASAVYPTFAAAVRAAATAIKVNIDVRNIEKHLIEGGVKMPSDARSSIATQLKALCDQDVIVRTHVGAGPIPHKYMVP